MLMLTRKNNGEIFINQGEIRIKIISSKAGEVLLGIHAPRHIDILRKEHFLSKEQEGNR
jgi:carbon storage regulator